MGVTAVWRVIAKMPTSVSLTLSSLKPPRRRVMAVKVGMNVAAVGMANGVWKCKGDVREQLREA